MIVYEHRLKEFGGKRLTVEKIPVFGWAVVGRVKPKAKGFAVVAAEAPAMGFRNRDKAREALAKVRA